MHIMLNRSGGSTYPMVGYACLIYPLHHHQYEAYAEIFHVITYQTLLCCLISAVACAFVQSAVFTIFLCCFLHFLAFFSALLRIFVFDQFISAALPARFSSGS